MLHKVATEKGNISISKSAISDIIKDVISQFDNKVFIANHKGTILKPWLKLSGLDEKNYINLSLEENELNIKLHVVLRFGTSISKVSEMLIEKIRQNIESSAGIKVSKITIIISGVLANKLSRRSIEITG